MSYNLWQCNNKLKLLMQFELASVWKVYILLIETAGEQRMEEW